MDVAAALDGRDKVTLQLPAAWKGGLVWTKQDFEESLGKSEKIGIKITITPKINIQNITTSEIKISCLIDQVQGKQALQIVHDAFELGGLLQAIG